MSEQAENPEMPQDKEIDPGEPIAALAGFEQSTSAGFMMHVRRKIQRRVTTAQVASFSWEVPFLVFLELWSMLIQLLNPKDMKKGSRT